MTLGRLQTAGLGRLETEDSAYQKPKPHAGHWNNSGNCPPSNDANRKESFGFLLTRFRALDGLLAWLADGRVHVGEGRRAAATSIIVKAFGDAGPQISEAISRAIVHTEVVPAAVLGTSSPDIDGGER